MAITFPYTLLNGSVANADQVMANFNALNVSSNAQVFYNITDYGAVGDGVTDCTSAIQSAINAAQSSSDGAVLIPEGNFLVTSTLTMQDGAIIKGINEYPYHYTYDSTKPYSKITFAPASELDLFNITNVVTGHSGYIWKIYIGGLFLEGNTTGAVTYSKYAINSKCAISVFENLGIRHFQDGIYCNLTMGNKYNNIHIRECSHAGIYTSMNTNTTDIFDNVWVDSCPWGAILLSCSFFRFLNCLWESLYVGGVQLSRSSTAEFVSNYAEDVPSTTSGANYGMFYVGHTGTVYSTNLSIIGGSYGGGSSTASYPGSFVDVLYLQQSDYGKVIVTPNFITRYTNGIKVDINSTSAYTVYAGPFGASSVTNRIVNNGTLSDGTFRVYGNFDDGGYSPVTISENIKARRVTLVDQSGNNTIEQRGFNTIMPSSTSIEIDYEAGDAGMVFITANDGATNNESGLFSVSHVSGKASITKVAGTDKIVNISSIGCICFSTSSNVTFITNFLSTDVNLTVLRIQ